MQLVSYLFFKDNAAEAFDFYAECLGGEIVTKVTVADMPGAENLPAEAQNLIAHIRLEAGDAVLMGGDCCDPAAEPYSGIHGSKVSLSVNAPEEADRYFEALSRGGKVTMPIGETAWSLRFGMLTDCYGAQWMVNCERPV